MINTRISLSIAFTNALLLSWPAAFAQQAPNRVGPIALNTPKVGAASAQIAPANVHRAGLYVFNPNAAVPLWVSPTGTPDAANGAGSVGIQPGQGVMFGPPNTPAWTNRMNAVAPSGASNSISILEY